MGPNVVLVPKFSSRRVTELHRLSFCKCPARNARVLALQK